MRENLTPRIELLRESLMKRGFSDRSTEWFRKNDLPDVAKMYPEEEVIVRRAYAIDEMLKAMCDNEKFSYTGCYKIENGDLLAGIIPMGSNGLGKVFPNYLTEEELRIGSVTNKNEMALLGHNSINYEKVLSQGLISIIETAQQKSDVKLLKGIEDAYSKKAFYKAVIISCNAVINYSHRFSRLADEMADELPTDSSRRKELKEMARVCRTVPENPATTFYEAVHSIWMVHCCLHATMDYMSLGRLDQVLNPYLEKEEDKSFAQSLIENFVIKAAGRLNLTTQYLMEQDHMDYNAALGIHPYYLDQRAGLNNFLQNVIIGGKKPNGEDATNPCTYLVLQAFKNVNLSTPGLYVRLHNNSPKELLSAVAESIKETKNLPYILNDEVMIPAMYDALAHGETEKSKLDLYQELANDYCVDGCWEPILNGKSEWTFGMINGLTILECTLNRGATLSNNPELLRGTKLSIDTGEITSMDNLMGALKKQMQFFVDQSTLAMCNYYATSEFVVPTPLVSALFDNCLEEGRDKSWGGAKYNLGGTILAAIPDMVNTIAAIEEWVFEKKKYQLADVLAAFRYNFVAGESGSVQGQRLFDAIKVDFFTNSAQFGNGHDTDYYTQTILDIYVEAIQKSKEIATKVFLDPAYDNDPKVAALRAIAGYYGPSIRSFLPNFDLKFTAGIGTFEQYNWQGAGNAASAARLTGDPIAPNFTPTSGTWNSNPGELFQTFKTLDLNRFAAGVITDMCLEPNAPVENILKKFIQNNGGMLTITIASEQYQEIYEIAKAANSMVNKKEASNKLLKYADIMVRVGGWNAPFITLPLVHMENYINRPIESN